jgi:hypothetical protein
MERDEGPNIVSNYRLRKFGETYRDTIEISTLFEKLIRTPQAFHTLGVAALQIPTSTSTDSPHPVCLIRAETHKRRGLGSISFPYRLPSILTFQSIQDRLLELRREISPRRRRLIPCIIRLVRPQCDAECGKVPDNAWVVAIQIGR